MEQMKGIEPSFFDWKSKVLTIELHLHAIILAEYFPDANEKDDTFVWFDKQ